MIDHTHLIEAYRGDRKVISLWVSYATTGGAKRRIRKESKEYGQGLTWRLFRVSAEANDILILEFTT